MTLPSSRSAACRKCGKDSQVEIYESINSHDRHLRDKLVSGALWRWRCKHCAHENISIYPLLYHDMRAWCMIYYLDRQVTEDPAVIRRMVPAAHQLTALRRFNLAYRFRLCRSLDDFIEKIRILDAGLDDRAVEYLKLRNRVFEKAAKTAANDMEKAPARAAMTARFERLIDGETRTLDFGPSPPASRTQIAFPAYSDALAKIDERLGSQADVDTGFLVVDRSYIEERFPEAIPKSREEASAAAGEPPEDMGSVVFGKTRRLDERRRSWWRFW